MNSLFLLYSLQTLSYGGNFAQNIGMHDFAISFFCNFPGEHTPIPTYSPIFPKGSDVPFITLEGCMVENLPASDKTLKQSFD